MTKQEKIQKAYIDLYGINIFNDIKYNIDDYGWINATESNFKYNETEFEIFKTLNTEKNKRIEYLVRPKALQDLEKK